jgi:hypothetical protein
VRRAEKPKRVLASRWSEVRSYRSGARSFFVDFSSLVIVPVRPRTAATTASASAAVFSRGCAPAW